MTSIVTERELENAPENVRQLFLDTFQDASDLLMATDEAEDLAEEYLRAGVTESATGGAPAKLLGAGFDIRAEPGPTPLLGAVMSVNVRLNGFPGHAKLTWKGMAEARGYMVQGSADLSSETNWRQAGGFDADFLCGQRRHTRPALLVSRRRLQRRRHGPLERPRLPAGDVKGVLSSHGGTRDGRTKHRGETLPFARGHDQNIGLMMHKTILPVFLALTCQTLVAAPPRDAVLLDAPELPMNYRLHVEFSRADGGAVRLGKDLIVPLTKSVEHDIAVEHPAMGGPVWRVWSGGKLVRRPEEVRGLPQNGARDFPEAKLDFSADFTAVAKFDSIGSGTLFSKCPPIGKWAPGSKALFIRDGRVSAARGNGGGRCSARAFRRGGEARGFV